MADKGYRSASFEAELNARGITLIRPAIRSEKTDRPLSTVPETIPPDHRIDQPDPQSPTRSRTPRRTQTRRCLRPHPATTPRAHRRHLAQRNHPPTRTRPITPRLRPLTHRPLGTNHLDGGREATLRRGLADASRLLRSRPPNSATLVRFRRVASPGGGAPAFIWPTFGSMKVGESGFDSRSAPLEVWRLQRTPARRVFKQNLGQANHFLVTLLVGLDAVERGAEPPAALNARWNPRSRTESVQRSRGSPPRSTLVSTC